MNQGIQNRLLAAQPDERLVALARNGHERAFEVLVHRYRRSLMRYCRRRLALSEVRAEDVVQQALLNAWVALRRGAEVRDLRPWLYRIVHNVAVNAMRRERPAVELEAAEHASYARAGEAADVACAQSIDERLEARDALASMAALPPMQREVMVRTAVGGHSHEEVASALGITDGAVRGLLYRARASIRAAAAALTPSPLIAWAAGACAPGGVASERITELAAGGGAAGLVGLAAKGGVAVITAGALITGAALAPANRSSVAPHTAAHSGGRAVAAQPGHRRSHPDRAGSRAAAPGPARPTRPAVRARPTAGAVRRTVANPPNTHRLDSTAPHRRHGAGTGVRRHRTLGQAPGSVHRLHPPGGPASRDVAAPAPPAPTTSAPAWARLRSRGRNDRSGDGGAPVANDLPAAPQADAVVPHAVHGAVSGRLGGGGEGSSSDGATPPAGGGNDQQHQQQQLGDGGSQGDAGSGGQQGGSSGQEGGQSAIQGLLSVQGADVTAQAGSDSVRIDGVTAQAGGDSVRIDGGAVQAGAGGAGGSPGGKAVAPAGVGGPSHGQMSVAAGAGAPCSPQAGPPAGAGAPPNAQVSSPVGSASQAGSAGASAGSGTASRSPAWPVGFDGPRSSVGSAGTSAGPAGAHRSSIPPTGQPAQGSPAGLVAAQWSTPARAGGPGSRR